MQNCAHTVFLPTDSYTIALVGNPNVGKSTIFNSLTGLKQHTGNWTGKTVSYAKGTYTYASHNYTLIDLPGTYSLATHSKEEEVTRDFICFNHPDAIIIVCDATCLERNLNLVLQTLSLTSYVVVCVNLIDEAHQKKIDINLSALSRLLHVPVISTCAKTATGLERLMLEVSRIIHHTVPSACYQIPLTPSLEASISMLIPLLHDLPHGSFPLRFLAIKLLEGEAVFLSYLQSQCETTSIDFDLFLSKLTSTQSALLPPETDATFLQDTITATYIYESEKIANQVMTCNLATTDARDRKIDHFLIGKYTRFPIMFLLLALILWLTIIGTNYPSEVLFNTFSLIEIKLTQCLIMIHTPPYLVEWLIHGAYRVLTWVVSVMLPPMAIFFPLFTLLEDVGYLPRIAFNLDHPFKKCHACGKQALTMCMGLGCNAVGVEGCRIIDSPRERLIALLTNSLIPCNGRFPTLILLINLFFTMSFYPLPSSLFSTFWLILSILFSLILTLILSWLLSQTLLKGLPSSFALELPPYRKPQIIKTLTRSLLDRTLYVLKRAVLVAAPTGFIIGLLANIHLGQNTLLDHLTTFLDPFAHIFGLNGVILTAFILGLPANEIIFPIIMMIYMSSHTMMPLSNPAQIKTLLLNNGWTFSTGLCTFVFFLVHWPCSTTLLTIYKETKSIKWTTVAFLLPTLLGLLLCFILSRILLIL